MNPVQRMVEKYPWTYKVIVWLLLIGYPVFFPLVVVIWRWRDILEWIATPFVSFASETYMWFRECWKEIRS